MAPRNKKCSKCPVDPVSMLPIDVWEVVARTMCSVQDVRSFANTCKSLRPLLGDARTPAHILWMRDGIDMALIRIINEFPVVDVPCALAYLRTHAKVDLNSLCVHKEECALSLLGITVLSVRPDTEIVAIIKYIVAEAGVDPNGDAFYVASADKRGNALMLILTMLHDVPDRGRYYATTVRTLLEVGTRRPQDGDDLKMMMRIARIGLFIDDNLSRVILHTRKERALRRNMVRDVDSVASMFNV